MVRQAEKANLVYLVAAVTNAQFIMGQQTITVF